MYCTVQLGLCSCDAVGWVVIWAVGLIWAALLIYVYSRLSSRRLAVGYWWFITSIVGSQLVGYGSGLTGASHRARKNEKEILGHT